MTRMQKLTSNKKHFNEMNSYVGMTMVKKEQGQDDYFNQQSILLKLPAYISPMILIALMYM